MIGRWLGMFLGAAMMRILPIIFILIFGPILLACLYRGVNPIFVWIVLATVVIYLVVGVIRRMRQL